MSIASSIYTKKKIQEMLYAYTHKIESAYKNKNYLSPEGEKLVSLYNEKQKSLISEALSDESFFGVLSDKELLDYYKTCKLLLKNLEININNLPDITEVKVNNKELVSERLDEIKELVNSTFVFNDKENRILELLNTFTDDELRNIQSELYMLQHKIYSKLDFSQNEKVREFYNKNRKGLFVTKDETGKILYLSYTPGNDIVFINRKGELLKYEKHIKGSRSEFFGAHLGIGTNRADWMLMVAGYDFDKEKTLMNQPTTDKKRQVFKTFNVYGNELKLDMAPEDKGNKVKEEVFRKFPEIYARFGSRVSGLNGNIIELDEGKGKVLGNIPYFHQSDNQTVDGPDTDKDKKVRGGNMCQLTSLAMVLSSKGIKTKDPKVQLEDELYKIAKKEGYGYGKSFAIWDDVKNMYGKILPQLNKNEAISGNGMEYDPKTGYEKNDIDLSRIVSQIDSGNPVIVDIKYGNNQGHVIVCIGYTDKNLIVHDPYGNLENCPNNIFKPERDYNGAYIEYPKIKYGIGENWIRYLVQKEVKNEK